jgi:3-deoxy-D-manno-octulosonate 8-phosphate phosphatase (KDO 8-P phosphatase)
MPAEKSITDIFKGRFVSSPSEIEQKLQSIKAYIFDWDGVFNDGHKYADGSSSFSETDSMGTNLIRFTHYLKNKELPAASIITGEHNKAAFHFAARENFHDVYYRIKHKETALQHFCDQNKIKSSEVLFVFDDVLDFSAAKIAGLRIMVSHSCNPLLIDFAIKNNLVDYITFHDGANGAIREASELIMELSGLFDSSIEHRMQFSSTYQSYINQRNKTPEFYTLKDGIITQQDPL